MFSVGKLVQITQRSIANAIDVTLLTTQLKGAGLPFVSLHTSALNARWHKDVVENRRLYRHGYIDKVKQSGALPRISEDSRRLRTIKVFRPANPFAPKEALFGQNDYIDILGDDPDAFRPGQLNYHAPEWLREVPGQLNTYQMALRKKEHLAKTSNPDDTYQWLRLNKRIERQYRKLRKQMDQHRWTNYKGIKSGDVSRNAFTTKYPF